MMLRHRSTQNCILTLVLVQTLASGGLASGWMNDSWNRLFFQFQDFQENLDHYVREFHTVLRFKAQVWLLASDKRATYPQNWVNTVYYIIIDHDRPYYHRLLLLLSFLNVIFRQLIIFEFINMYHILFCNRTIQSFNVVVVVVVIIHI